VKTIEQAQPRAPKKDWVVLEWWECGGEGGGGTDGVDWTGEEDVLVDGS
jgi:hypothetical protein